MTFPALKLAALKPRHPRRATYRAPAMPAPTFRIHWGRIACATIAGVPVAFLASWAFMIASDPR